MIAEEANIAPRLAQGGASCMWSTSPQAASTDAPAGKANLYARSPRRIWG
ncbi:MAG: hypothetical protein ACLVL7_04550 [Anaerotruncus massiliensis (ex Togo et al. 2019)]